MKKLLALLTVGCAMLVPAVKAGTYFDKTNLDQLNFRTLAAGQVGWIEEEGGATIYVGSPTESKTLRVFDPAALRGYRYKEIDDNISFYASNMVSSVENGTNSFTYTSASTDALLYDYEEAEGNANGTTTYYTKSGDSYVSAGVLTEGTSLTNGTTYYIQYPYVNCRITVFSQSAQIEELDFLYTETAGGFGDMNPITCTREITYDGQKAYIDLKVHTEHSGVFAKVSSITAKTMGIGDIVQVNNLETTKILIYDKISPYTEPSDDDDEDTSKNTGFDLFDLRYWAAHLYDGNRGEHWSRYAASNNVEIGIHKLGFSGRDSTNGVHRSSISADGANFIIAHKDVAFLQYSPATSNSSQYAGCECQITEWLCPSNSARDENDDYPECYRMEINFTQAIPQALVSLQWRNKLDSGYWYVTTATIVPIDNTQMAYYAYIPQVFNEVGMGFWKVVVPVGLTDNRLFIRATVSVIASDGKFYKLTFPTGGGAVTAVEDEAQGSMIKSTPNN